MSGHANDVDQLMETGRINRLSVIVTALGFVIAMIDGYDVAVLAFAAPAIIHDWGLSGAFALAPALTASLLGMMVGAPVFGTLGDRFGRRTAIIIACLVFGVATLPIIMSTSPTQLALLRFLAGLGLGGATPNTIALVSEYAPARLRALMVTLMFSGIALGSAIPGFALLAQTGSGSWRFLFAIGGVVPLCVALVCAALMPESILYLVNADKGAKAERLLARIGYTLPLRATSEPLRSRRSGRTSPLQLFTDGRAAATLALWTMVFCVFMTYFFLQTWAPTLLRKHGLSQTLAVSATTAFQLGGFVGGIVAARVLDVRGRLPLMPLLIVAAALVAAVGFGMNGSAVRLVILESAAGFLALGLNFVAVAMSGLLYPTAIRSTGSGWALGVGRLASIISALAGGAVVASGTSVERIFVLAAMPLVVGAIASAAFGLRRTRQADHEVSESA